MHARVIVIDTQSLFDWLVFGNPACAGWGDALDNGAWQWIATAPMRAEFDHVAAKGFGERWTWRPDDCEAAWSRHVRMVEVPVPPGAALRLVCTDADDQMFIDLAIAAKAHTLVSRDKALLRLARRAAQRHGVRICTPQTWSAAWRSPAETAPT